MTSSSTAFYGSPYPATELPPAPPAVSRFAALTPADGPAPRWARPAFGALVLGSALLYLVGLGSSGNANSFYAAAVQAGTLSWKAFFFGSLDAGNFITVDKPPMSLWPMELAGRIFGFTSWSMLVPQALMGVASVALLTLTVRRWFGWTAGLVAGVVLALTPVAVVMFRFNNPDALMTLLLVVGAWALTRALETGRLRWTLLVGVTFGFGFLTKGLQPFTVLPAFALALLLFAPMGWGRRVVHLLLGGVAIVVSAGWWVVTVLLWPASDRPYIGGSTNNNPLELAFGYNGLGRLTGNEGGGPTGMTAGAGTGSATAAAGGGMPGGGGGGMSFSGSTGIGRLFNSEMGGQISWLLPAALLALVGLAAVGVLARRSGTDARRLQAATVVWGGWLLVTGAVLSFASGTIHAYYTVQLAPAIAGLVGIGLVVAWRMRAEVGARVLVAAATGITAVWAFALLDRSPTWFPWLRWVVLVVGLAVAVAVVAGPAMGAALRRPVGVVVAVALTVAALGAPAAYAASTAATPHQGSTPSAGPEVAGSGFGGSGFGGSRGGRFPGGGFPGGSGSGQSGSGQSGSGQGGFPGGGFPGGSGSGQSGTGQSGSAQSGGTGGFPTGSAPSAGTAPTGGNGSTATNGTTAGRSGAGGGPGEQSVSSELASLLEATDSRWAAATIGSQSAASLELATGGKAVMAIGGFVGSDPAPTLAQFKAWVAAGDVRYFVAGGGMGGGRGGNSEITAWVEANFTAQTVGSSTVYDLQQASS